MLIATQETHISSLVVYAAKNLCSEVESELNAFSELEVVISDIAAGKIVVLSETKTMNDIKSHISRIQDIAGVLSVNMIYHHAESPESLQEVIA